MKDLTLKDEWGDSLSVELDKGSIVAVGRAKDALDQSRTTVVKLTEAQGRELYMWLAEAIGVVEEGYNERHR